MLRWITGMSVGLALAGCGNSGGDPGFVTSAIRCESVCQARNGSCGVDEAACLGRCQTEEVMAERLGCMSAHYASMNCSVEHAELCGENLALVCAPQDEALKTCVYDGCGANPTDAFCIDRCTTQCEDLAYRCGGDASQCAPGCQYAAGEATRLACGDEYWTMLECMAELGDSCDAAALQVYCAEEASAFEACYGDVTPDPDPDPGIVIMTPAYASCDATRACDASTCVELSTETTRGSMCTLSCASIADCPGQDVRCLPVGADPVRYCLTSCEYYSCPSGTYCEQVYDAEAYEWMRVCLPDV